MTQTEILALLGEAGKLQPLGGLKIDERIWFVFNLYGNSNPILNITICAWYFNTDAKTAKPKTNMGPIVVGKFLWALGKLKSYSASFICTK